MPPKKRQYKIVPPTPENNYYTIMGKDEGESDEQWRWVSTESKEDKANHILDNLNKYGTVLSPEEQKNQKQLPGAAVMTDGSKDKKTTAKTKTKTQKQTQPTAQPLSVYEQTVKSKKWNSKNGDGTYVIDEGNFDHIKKDPNTTNKDIAEIEKELKRRHEEALANAKKSGSYSVRKNNGSYVISNDELISLRSKSKKGSDEYKKIQDEINRRYRAGEAPEFAPPKKVNKPVEAKSEVNAKDTEAVTEDAKVETEEPKSEVTSNTISLGNKEDVESFDEKANNGNAWNRFIYGNNNGSVNKDFAKVDGMTYKQAKKEYENVNKEYSSLYDKAKELEDAYKEKYGTADSPTDEELAAAEQKVNTATTDEERATAQSELDALKSRKAEHQAMNDAIYAANNYRDNELATAKAKANPSAYKDAAKMNKEEKKKLAEEFIADNPNVLKGIFGNSGKNFGERMALLGEMLAVIGANAARGWSTKGSAEPIKSSTAEMYKDAISKGMERTQEKLDAKTEYENSKENTKSIFEQSEATRNWDPAIVDGISEYVAAGNNLSEDKLFNFISDKVSGLPESELSKYGLASIKNEDGTIDIVKGENWGNVVDTYNNAWNVSSVRQKNQNANLDINQKEASLESTKIANLKSKLDLQEATGKYEDYIYDKIRELQKQKGLLRTANAKEILQIAMDYKGIVAGVDTLSDSVQAGSSFSDATQRASSQQAGFHEGMSTDVSASASGNIYFVKAQAATNFHGELSADQQFSNSQQNSHSKTVNANKALNRASDVRAAQFLDKLGTQDLQIGNDTIAEMSKDLDSYRRVATAQIDAEIERLQQRAKELVGNTSDIKAKTVFGISNHADFDKHQHMHGHNGNPINKDFDYYLNRLRG